MNCDNFPYGTHKKPFLKYHFHYYHSDEQTSLNMKEDALLDQFSMTFDLLPLQGQHPKNDDALLEQFSMSFDLSPLVKEEKEDMSKKGEEQTKTTKKEKFTKANDRNADIVKNKTQKVVGVYVCKLCDKDLGHRKGIYDHIRMRHKMKWIEYASEQELDIKREKKAKKEKKIGKRKSDTKSEEKEADNKNTKTHDEENTEQKQKRKGKNRKFKYQDFSDKLGKKKAKKLKVENVNQADIKRDIVTLDKDENKTGGETIDIKNNAELSINHTKTEKANVTRKNKQKIIKREFHEGLSLENDKSFKN